MPLNIDTVNSTKARNQTHLQSVPSHRDKALTCSDDSELDSDFVDTHICAEKGIRGTVMIFR